MGRDRRPDPRYHLPCVGDRCTQRAQRGELMELFAGAPWPLLVVGAGGVTFGLLFFYLLLRRVMRLLLGREARRLGVGGALSWIGIALIFVAVGVGALGLSAALSGYRAF